MIGIKVNGVFWDMQPGTSEEIERKSPFFSINDIATEYSTPITFTYSAANDQGSNFYFQYYTERINASFDVEYYDGPLFKSKATLVLEDAAININRIEESQLTGYLLFSLSNFYLVIKDKKLKELKLGGIRTLNYTTNNPTDGSNGYWQHFHQTWTDDSIPYLFTPIRNEIILGEGTDAPDWMNKLGPNGKLAFDFASPIVPFIRLKYLLTQVFTEHGFTVDFSGLNDVVWEKLFLVNLTKLDWVLITAVTGDPPVSFTPQPNIKIDLRRHVPQEKTIFDLLKQLFNRYGWAPLFNLQRRHVRYVALKEVGKGTRKDWTMFANPRLSTSFKSKPKIWAFKTEIDSNDEYPSAPDFTGIKFFPPYLSIHYATNPTVAMEGKVAFSYDDNKWYQVRLDDQTNTYTWQLFADNIYDHEPENATDTISSTISTLPIFFSEYRTNNFNQKRYCYFPYMLQNTNKPIGYRLLVYHGLNYELNSDRAAAELMIPYSSSIREQSFGTSPLPWSNVLKHPLFGGSIYEEEYGIIKYWFQQFLDTMVRGEESVFTLRLPLLELLNFNWDDVIMIRQLPYMVMQFTEPTPYEGFVQATLKRIVKKQLNVSNGNLRPVYVKLTVFNLNPISFNLQYAGTVNAILCDVKINVYKDAAGTDPYTPVTALSLPVRIKRTDDGAVTQDQAELQTIANDEEIIYREVLKSQTVPVNHTSVVEFTIDASTTGEYIII